MHRDGERPDKKEGIYSFNFEALHRDDIPNMAVMTRQEQVIYIVRSTKDWTVGLAIIGTANSEVNRMITRQKRITWLKLLSRCYVGWTVCLKPWVCFCGLNV